MATIAAHFQAAEREAAALFMGAEDEGDANSAQAVEELPQIQQTETDEEKKRRLIAELSEYGIIINDPDDWSLNELESLRSAIDSAAQRLHGFAHEQGVALGLTPQEVFSRIFGNLTFERERESVRPDTNSWGWYSNGTITLSNAAFNNVLTSFADFSTDASQRQSASTQFLIFHELGHDLNNEVLMVRKDESGRYQLVERREGV